MKKHILVLLHANTLDSILQSYGVFIFSKYWEEMGYKVTFQKGTGKYVPADLVFVHVDLSVVPDEYLEYTAQYPVAVNNQVNDIRKSVISGNIIRDGDDWQGPVIAKSDLNCAGTPEYNLSYRKRLKLNFISRQILHAWDLIFPGSGLSPFKSWEDYRVFEHFEQVPEKLREDPRVVIERFLPEFEDGLYHMRMYQFLGNKWNCRRVSSHDPLVKANVSSKITTIEPHPVVESWRKMFKLDYGKLDYLVHNGNPVLIDVNKTPSTNVNFEVVKDLEHIRRERAEGIKYFFEHSAAW